ncbi:hypothetical protein [Photobacterium leiognathi]|uniref:hypothetical protein n=1 Tax=Photobacterium leiognathi TaxID=553611 RepID=UPI002981DE80|nr:hypothetical protein [Photobacterium leiognathi]
MNKYNQSGMTTLLITSMLLIIALLFSLASYKNLFYQIKRTQNEVLARQAHWVSEGGIECGYSLLNEVKNNTVLMSELDEKCKNKLGISLLDITDVPPYKLLTVTVSNSGYSKTISKKFKMAGVTSSGVLKSTSDIYFKGSIVVSPDPGALSSGTYWQCVMLRFKTKFTVSGSFLNQGLIGSLPPYTGFPSGQSCKSGYQSTLVSGDWNKNNISSYKDIIYDADFDPFLDTFNEPRSKWLDIKNRNDFDKIEGGLVNINEKKFRLVNNCEGEIAKSINNNFDLIWVVGTCELKNFDVIDDAIANNNDIDGVILVIQDGLFSVDGSHKFPGMIYHLNISFQPNPDLWGLMSSHKSQPIPTSLSLDKVSYYQRGAFMPSGGYVLDAPGQIAVFGTSMNFLYNKDLIEKPMDKLKKVSWVEGSWNDL